VHAPRILHQRLAEPLGAKPAQFERFRRANRAAAASKQARDPGEIEVPLHPFATEALDAMQKSAIDHFVVDVVQEEGEVGCLWRSR
jgi:hypothetical protein